jgi:putative endonuclease
MSSFYYIYVLQSLKDGKNYTGYSRNLKLRFEQHCNGEVEFTKNRRPLRIIYFEGCHSWEKMEVAIPEGF